LIGASATVAHASGPVMLLLTFEKNLPLTPVGVNVTPGLIFILDSADSGCLINTGRAAALQALPIMREPLELQES
jgi:hypothetical protein